MQKLKDIQSPKQQLFREMVLGTLVYSVVLGFFNDYTNILHIETYSTTFFTAIVLQLLTYSTFGLKNVVIKHFKDKEGSKYKIALGFGVWLIMFLSKFVFLAAIDFIFGNAVEISGFVGLALIIAIMTISKKLIDVVYVKLA
jgi:hypothetical protein